MLSFVDRAADLPFEDFGPGMSYNYLAPDLTHAIRIALLRAVVKAFDGDGDGAARSLYSAVRAGRWFGRDGRWWIPYLLWSTTAVQITLERSRAGDAELERLARALAESDDDNILRQAFLRMRAGMLLREGSDNRWLIGSRAAPLFVVDKPWRTHQLNRQLAWYAGVLEAVDAPWPDRIDAIDRIEYFNLDVPFTREAMQQYVQSAVGPLAMFRGLRIAVAVERFQRGRAEQLPVNLSDMVPSYLTAAPVDPFTGQPLRYVRIPDGFVAYSAGLNRTDDGGDVAAQWGRGSDLGVRVRSVDQEKGR